MKLKMEDLKTSTNPHMRYHIAPVEGLMNDPQGLIQYKGVYHLFYQWNPTGLKHENKAWGHLVSKDLIRWKELPIALKPDQEYDKDGCYTGSAIEHEGVMYIIYTGNVIEENGERSTYHCLAKSKDGINFQKLGPIIDVPDGYTRHVRDPKIWKERNMFYLVLGAQTENKKGRTLLYKSLDLYNWELKGQFIDKEIELGYMWECPNYIRFKEIDFFIFSPQGVEQNGIEFNNLYQSGYLSGIFEKEMFRIENENFIELDRGFEFYAPQVFKDRLGRYILFAWMGVMSDEKERNLPTVKENWLHIMTLPRELSYKENRIIQKPINELKSLRGGKIAFCGSNNISLSASELEIVIKNIDDSVSICYRDELLIEYDSINKMVHVSRSDWITDLREKRSCRIMETCRDIRIYLEKTSAEVFINGGEEVFSLRYFTDNDNRLEIKTNGNAIKTTIYALEVNRNERNNYV